jgi:uncharacterized protein YecT (DUF1311 family)
MMSGLGSLRRTKPAITWSPCRGKETSRSTVAWRAGIHSLERGYDIFEPLSRGDEDLRSYRSLVVTFAMLVIGTTADARDSKTPAREATGVLSSEFRQCFGPDAPLDAESYGCLDREYRRLDALLTNEYRAALARQPKDAAREKLIRDERRWWRIRFRHCKGEVGDLRARQPLSSTSPARLTHWRCV